MKKFMHKSLSIILVMTLVLSLFSGLSFSSAADLPVVGICGNDLTYTFDNTTGKLTIYGVGDMTDYCSSGSNSPFYNQTKIKKVIIGNSVTSICREAFSCCYRLTSVTIGSSVTNIGRDAFSFCSGLTSVTIPDSVTNIGMDAFSGCSGLTSITIPGSVTSIGASAFSGCSGLTSVTIPDSVTKIVGSAFSGCSGLTSITVANNNKKYDSRDNCNAIIETDTNTLIDGCKKTVIPDSVTSIGTFAFSGCSGLTSITIPNSITSIDWYAFSGCSGLTNITIPDSVTSIGMDAFSGCSGLTSITIPNSVTSIGMDAFSGCSGLTSVTILDSVTMIGSDAFSRCSGLKTAGPIGSDCNYEFGWTSTIPSDAFSGCSGLTGITIPNSVTSIGRYAFYGCSGLKELTMPCSAKIYNSEYTFKNCTNIEKITLTKGTGAMQNYAYSTGNNNTYYQYTPWFISKSNLKELVIEDGVTSIGSYAFYGCSGLTSVTIPNSVTSIGDDAFYRCSGLTNITIPNSVTSIGSAAFSGCSGLTSIDIKGDNCSIYDYAETLPGNATIIINGSKNVYNYAVKYNRNYICNHVEVIDEAKESTCLENGLTQGMHCDICSKVIQDQETTSALGHDYQKTAVVAPTCSEQGYTLYTCSRCSDSYKLDYANPLGHIEKEMITEPTCTSAGLKNIVCERCQQVLKTDVNTSALGHDYEKTTVVAPTCLERGYTTYTCSRCSDSYNADYKNALGHIEKEVITKSPTCTERGSKDIVCERCEQTVRGNISIPALKHNYNATVTSPTCTEEGYTTYTCTRCSDSYKTNYIYALGHIEKDQIIRSSTCTELGSKNVFCERCQQIVKKGVPIPALGHDYSLSVTEPTCTNEGYTTYVCNRCESLYNSNYVSSLGHNALIETVVKPTSTQLGYTKHSCSRCGELQRVDTFTAPTGKLTLKHSARTANAIKVQWNNMNTATGYQVQISTKDGKKWSTYATLKAGVTNYTFKSLAAGNNYKFRVRFYINAPDGKNYFSPWSSTLTSPTLPTGTALTKLTPAKKAFTAQWKKNATVNGYQVQYSLKANFAGAKTITVKNPKSLKATAAKLYAGKYYFVRIRTYKTIAKANYFSAWSKTYKVKTK